MSRYKKQLSSDRWKRFADDVKRRDGYKCVECGCTSNLQVHHKVYYQNKSPWDYTIDLLETLCGRCHKGKHNGISIDTFVAKDRKQFKDEKRKERSRYRQINSRLNIFRRGMTADDITKALADKDMKQVHEVYTFEDNKYVVKFSSTDKDIAYEFLHQHNGNNADNRYRLMSLFTYNNKQNERETSQEDNKES